MENLFELLVKNIDIPIWIKDLDYRFIFVNKRYAQLCNKKVEEVVGLKNEDLFDSFTCEKFNSHCKRVLEKGKTIVEDMYTANGYRECSVIPLKDENKNIVAIAGIVGVITDLGRIKEKDYELEQQKTLTNQIIDMLPGVIFYKDRESKYVYANKACRDFYAERGIENIIGKTDAEINPDKKQVEKFMKDDQTVIETKTPMFNEAILRGLDGNNIYKEVVKMPLTDNYGNVNGIVGRSLDITEKKKAHERLEYLSYTDILTGAKNRTCFEDKGNELSKKEYLPLGVIMGDANGLKLVNDTFGHEEGDNLLKETVNVLKEACKDEGEVFRIGGDEFVILVPNASSSQCEKIINKIVKKCKEYDNKLFNLSISLGFSIKNDTEIELYEALKEAEDKVYRQKLLQNKSIKSSILNSLKIGIATRAGETDEHVERVTKDAVQVGEKLGLEMSKLDELKIVANLHDIGKIGIREDILLKPGPLTFEEYEIMKTHSEKGYRIITASNELRSVAESVLYHHERYDGTGYPRGLKGNGIPLLSRIISVCDAYDVMTHDSVYKKAKSKEAAFKELKECSGTQFDPEIVDIFIEIKKNEFN